jgi:hypothetical protein
MVSYMGQAQHNKRHTGPTMTHSLIVLQAHMLGHDKAVALLAVRGLDVRAAGESQAVSHEPATGAMASRVPSCVGTASRQRAQVPVPRLLRSCLPLLKGNAIFAERPPSKSNSPKEDDTRRAFPQVCSRAAKH